MNTKIQNQFYFIVYNATSLFDYDPSDEGWTKFATVSQIDQNTWSVTKRETAWFEDKDVVNPDWLQDIGKPIAEGYYRFDDRFLNQIPIWQKELSYIGEFGFKARKEVRSRAREWIKNNYAGRDKTNRLTFFKQEC